MIPLFTTLVFYFIARFIQSKTDKQKIWAAIFAGAFFALGFYTYIAYRIMIFILLGLAAVFAFAQFKKYNRGVLETFLPYKKYIAIAALSFIIFFYPLAHYFYTHPGSFIGRSGQVSVFSPSLNKGDLAGTIIDVAEKTVASFFKEGDANWRHNVSGEPFLPLTVSLLFLGGLAYCLWRSVKYVWQKTDFNDGKHLILTAWFLAMLVPEMTTAEGIPHGLRLIGVIPAVFIFPAVALGKILNWVAEKFGQSSVIRGLTVMFIAAFLAIILTNSYNLYFGYYANSPAAYYAYRSDLTSISDYLNQRNNKAQTYLSLDKFSEQTVLYFTTKTGNPYQLITPEKSYEVKLKRNDQIIFTQSTLFDITKFKEYHPKANLVRADKNKFGQTIMEVFEE